MKSVFKATNSLVVLVPVTRGYLWWPFLYVLTLAAYQGLLR
ncbi:hypothetical protein THF5H11_70098 [Vibrio jasicida]|nr:hypothetical protein THF5H11_70098 [Vibrio jasicida]